MPQSTVKNYVVLLSPAIDTIYVSLIKNYVKAALSTL